MWTAPVKATFCSMGRTAKEKGDLLLGLGPERHCCLFCGRPCFLFKVIISNDWSCLPAVYLHQRHYANVCIVLGSSCRVVCRLFFSQYWRLGGAPELLINPLCRSHVPCWRGNHDYSVSDPSHALPSDETEKWLGPSRQESNEPSGSR